MATSVSAGTSPGRKNGRCSVGRPAGLVAVVQAAASMAVSAGASSARATRISVTPQGSSARSTHCPDVDRGNVGVVRGFRFSYNVFGQRIDALDAVWRRWAEVGGGLTDADWSAPSRCAGWDVAALFAHV